MRKRVILIFSLLPVVFLLVLANIATVKSGGSKDLPLSDETRDCIECHEVYTPGIVADWRTSRHSQTTVTEALKKTGLELIITGKELPENLAGVAVGCYECHGLRAETHPDNFEHEGYQVNVVVTPNDCAVCHAEEAEQYKGSKKAHAVGNLLDNPVFSALVETVISVKNFDEGGLKQLPASESTRGESCFACHGTKVTVDGTEEIETAYGKMEFPKLSGWPNQGVGRVNPDGSLGSCTACHPRHSFSIAVARRPYTCLQCHLNPDVPGWEVYRESKHGNIFLSQGGAWDWDAVPWQVGRDFRAPTCSACHNALLTDAEGEVIAPRSHDFGARLYVRIFGLIYSHPQPKGGKTYEIKNADGLPLPLTFKGAPAVDYLIDQSEQERRRAGFVKICTGCHSTAWSMGHFDQLDATIVETDKMVLTATQLMLEAWNGGLVDAKNPFDEALEQKWVAQWLFYANSVRYGSAMGGPDYSTFKNGWWNLTHNLQEIHDGIVTKTP